MSQSGGDIPSPVHSMNASISYSNNNSYGDVGDPTAYRSTPANAQKALANAEGGGFGIGAIPSDVKLQKPLEPRELPESAGSDPHNVSIQMSKFDNLPSILRHRGKSISKHNAFVVLDNKGKEVSAIAWDKLAARAEKVAQMIRDKSRLYRGDRVTLLYQESEVADFVVALLGCFLAGVVAVPVSPSSPFKDIAYILSSTQSHLALTTDNNLKSLQRTMTSQRLQWPRNVEWWKTNEFGSYHPPNKKAELPALQVPDLAYIEFVRSPLGELRGVVMSHRTILHQMTCLTAMLQSRDKAKGNNSSSKYGGADTVLCNLDIRQTVGLIVGVLMTVYSGNCLVYVPQNAMAVGGLYANAITRYRANILLSDYPSLKQVAYNYQSFPHLTRNYSKKQPVNFSSIRWCLIDALTIDSEFHEVLADRWLKPLGNQNARDIVSPMLTLSEHGGMVISMRDWLEGQEKLGCELNMGDHDNDDKPSDLSEVLLDKDALTKNRIKIVSSSPSRNWATSSEETKKYIRVGAFGYPLPDAALAVVNPDTCVLAQEMDVGEIWIDSPSLSGGFWGLVRETDTVFHATCYDKNGLVDMEFLRTGLLGFQYNGKLYVLGLYEDRIRQKVDTTNTNDNNNNNNNDVQSLMAVPEYRYHYTAHLVHTIMRSVPRVFDCSAFDVFVNGEHLPVAVLETSLATSAVGGGASSGSSGSGASGVITTQTNYNFAINSQSNMNALNELAEKCMEILNEVHGVRLYCVLITPSNSLPRIVRSGRSEIGNMLCKRRFDLGALPATYVKFGIDKAIRSLPVGQDPVGGIWSPAISRIRTDSLEDAEKQYSGVDFRGIVIDDRTAAPLSDFESIVQILQWRVTHQSDELAYSTIDIRAREGKGLSWKKFDQKVATVANHLKLKLRLRAGDSLLLMYTHSEEYVIAVYACFVLGITAIPISPLDSTRLQEDIPAFLDIIKHYGVRTMLVNNDTEGIMKMKAIHQQLKTTSSTLKMSTDTAVPQMINTAKLKVNATASTKDMNLDAKCLMPDFPALVWLYWTPDHRYHAVQMGHNAVMGMCKIQKETCQMTSTRPIVGCVRSVNGLGFLHTCTMGVYLGASTLLVSPVDYATNPATFFLTLSRYKVKDTYSTPQMIDHACATMKPKGFSLAETKNLMVTTDGRPRTDLVKRVRILFSPTGLESTTINLGYSHVLNPLITTRSYMSLEPIDLWLDPIALRQGYVSVVNPENYPNALHLHDSGMVPVSTQVAIVNPETCQLCRIGEYGEIWVYSEGNISDFYKNRDSFNKERLHGKIVDGNVDVEYVRTGDLGFLHTVSRQLPGSGGQSVEMQTLFVLGSIGETFEVLGLNHFPIDIENSVEKAHKSIIPGGTAVFQAGGMIILVAEVNQTPTNTTNNSTFSSSSSQQRPANSGNNRLSLASLVPVIVNTVLDEHQFVIDIVAFVARGQFVRSRLQEKQRGTILNSWVNKKLSILAQFGVSQGERTLARSINRQSVEYEES